MPSLAQRAAILRRSGRAAREQALLSAVPWAQGTETDVLVIELLECMGRSREPRRVLTAALSAWPRLTPATRDLVLSAAANDLDDAAVKLSESAAPSDRGASAELSGDLLSGLRRVSAPRRARHGSILERLALDAEPEVAAAARRAVARACEAALQDDDAPEHDAALEGPIEAALCAALEGYVEHRDSAPVHCALKVVHRPGPHLRRWLDRPDEPGHMALRSAARRLAPESVSARLIDWLAVPALAPVAAEWAEVGGPDAQTRLLEGAALLPLRGRAIALRRLRAVEKLLPSDARLAEDPAPLRRASIRLARLLVRPERRLLHISGFLADPEPAARMDAVLALSGEPAGRLVDETLTDFTLDPCPEVSAAAACALASAQSPSRRRTVAPCFRTLLRSPHEATRSLADQVLREFDPFSYPDGDRQWESAAAAARARHADEKRFVDECLEQLRSGPVRQRVGVLGTLSRLRLASRVFDELVVLLTDKDQRVAAKAAHLLGRCAESLAARVLEDATDHSDPRVRAEAVEGLWRLHARVRFERWAEDDTPRVRANAIRALIGADRAAALRFAAAMIDDPRAPHRASGLWIAEVGDPASGGLVELAPRAVERAENERDPLARARARRCATRLMARSRLLWDDAPSRSPSTADGARAQKEHAPA
ncbi:MAG: HEAT repeat domain-containing protein [Phycisphaerales bacterium]